MPAFGPQNLAKFNDNRPASEKIYVKIGRPESIRPEVSFCTADGTDVDDAGNRMVVAYYGTKPEKPLPLAVNPMGRRLYNSDKLPFPWGYGYMHKASPPVEGECRKAYIIGSTTANKGWGVMIYDILIQLAGKNGLTPDRQLVSQDAANVWIRYLEDRKQKGHVRTEPLDPITNLKDVGKLTPDDPSDDCISDHHKNTDWNPEVKDKSKGPKIIQAVNNVYYAKDLHVIDELKQLGLVWTGEMTKEPSQEEKLETKNKQTDQIMGLLGIHEELNRLYASLLLEVRK